MKRYREEIILILLMLSGAVANYLVAKGYGYVWLLWLFTVTSFECYSAYSELLLTRFLYTKRMEKEKNEQTKSCK